MDPLDEIPWKNLTHAYGSAEDVPGLLRAIKTASPDMRTEESPIWQLFGNIWHQGTIYEATSYAVPFLVELAVDPQTPDRLGVLSLLAEIAKSGSRQETHSRIHDAAEHLWRQNVCETLLAHYSQLAALTSEAGDLKYAAACVLAQFGERHEQVAAILQNLLAREERVLYRAGLLLLLGETSHESPQGTADVCAALHAPSSLERQAAAFAVARLGVRPIPSGGREAIREVIDADDLELSLGELPWNATDGLDPCNLFALLDAAEWDEEVDRLITIVETGKWTTCHIETVIYLLFQQSPDGPTPRVTPESLTPRQLRAVRAIFQAMQGGRRVSNMHFPCRGLPDTMREWRALAQGVSPPPIDKSLPMLAAASRPREPVALGRLKVGDVVIHRHFGRGRVTQLDMGEARTQMTVFFEEEGEKQLAFATRRST